MPIQEEFSFARYISVVITGQTEEEVNCLIEHYYREFPKQGYATEVTQPPCYLGGDLWEARMKRYASSE